MAFNNYTLQNIDQDELRADIYRLLMESSADNKRLSIRGISNGAGVCHLTIMRFLEGKKMRPLSLCRLAEFVKKYKESE